MQFFFQVFIVFCFAFLASLITAEIFLSSALTKKLHPAVRISGGYILQLTFFSAAFKFIPMTWAWAAALAFLALYTVGFSHFNISWSSIKAYRNTFLGFLLAAQLFFLPLHLSRTYGPFSEGGGDITIYSDTAKYIVDRNMSVWGLSDAIYRLRTAIETKLIGPLGELRDNQETMREFDAKLGNPPSSGYDSVRLATIRNMPSLAFTPVAQWFFLWGKTNFATYFAIEAFQYAAILMCFWALFRRFGKKQAAFAFLLVASSHGLVSVYYNHYFHQGLELMIETLFLALVLEIPLFSKSGLKLYGPGLTIAFVGYMHFLSLLIPMIAIPEGIAFLKTRSLHRGSHSKPSSKDAESSKVRVPYLQRIAIYGAAILIISWAFFELLTQIVFAKGMILQLFETIKHSLSSSSKPILSGSFMGESVQLFSSRGLSFIFGGFSQQHYPPLVIYSDWVLRYRLQDKVPYLTNLFGILTFSLGIWVCCERLKQKPKKGSSFDPPFGLLVLFFTGVFTCISHYLISKMSYYMQAKGAQNALPILYAWVLLLPFAMLEMKGLPPASRLIRWLLPKISTVFIGLLLITNLYFSFRVAFKQDRATILETSYLQARDSIFEKDSDPFVLVEPRNSADLYLGAQPFAGARLLFTRHLTYQTASQEGFIHGSMKRHVTPTDLMMPEDWSHLWLLSPTIQKTSHSRIFGEHIRYLWEAKKLTDLVTPRLILSGSQYEELETSLKNSELQNDLTSQGWINRGQVLVWIPVQYKNTDLDVAIEVMGNDLIHLQAVRDEMISFLKQKMYKKVSVEQPNLKKMSFALRFSRFNEASGTLLPLYRSEGFARINLNIQFKPNMPH